MNFDLHHVSLIEFGVGLKNDNHQTFVVIPVDKDVQAALQEMVQTTWNQMQKDAEGPTEYDPSEIYESIKYLYLPLENPLAETLRNLHHAKNLDINSRALTDGSYIFCYFAKMKDTNNHRLTALRRAAQFKGILKSKGRLIRLWDDTLRIVKDDVFKLDSDFDLLIDDVNIHILRPSGFEFLGRIQEAVLESVHKNIEAIQEHLPFVEFENIQEYAVKHPRAARYLAAIRKMQQTKNIEKGALKKLCKSTGVELTEAQGKIHVHVGHEIGFLEVLDRRRYEICLVRDQTERYRAASRKNSISNYSNCKWFPANRPKPSKNLLGSSLAA